jgi:hypothetical protein
LIRQTTDQNRESESEMIDTSQPVNLKPNFTLLTIQPSQFQNTTTKNNEIEEHDEDINNRTNSIVPLSSEPSFLSLSQASIYCSEIFHFLTVMKKLFEFAQKYDLETDCDSCTQILSLSSSWILEPQTMKNCK